MYRSKAVGPPPVSGFQRFGAAVACDGFLVEPACLRDRSECPGGIGSTWSLRGALPGPPDGGRGVRRHPVYVHRGQGRPWGVLQRALLAGGQENEQRYPDGGATSASRLGSRRASALLGSGHRSRSRERRHTA
ncbi:MAG: hypothetical protein OXH99_00950 [Bryobacterales bacterium]|nr:hypothetical protein [Bryobacterales bacterium]